MLQRCDCRNIKHKGPCGNPPKKVCLTCGDRLCPSCARNHHAHSNFEPFDPLARAHEESDAVPWQAEPPSKLPASFARLLSQEEYASLCAKYKNRPFWTDLVLKGDIIHDPMTKRLYETEDGEDGSELSIPFFFVLNSLQMFNFWGEQVWNLPQGQVDTIGTPRKYHVPIGYRGSQYETLRKVLRQIYNHEQATDKEQNP